MMGIDLLESRSTLRIPVAGSAPSAVTKTTGTAEIETAEVSVFSKESCYLRLGTKLFTTWT
jgi:hypothetical protein